MLITATESIRSVPQDGLTPGNQSRAQGGRSYIVIIFPYLHTLGCEPTVFRLIILRKETLVGQVKWHLSQKWITLQPKLA